MTNKELQELLAQHPDDIIIKLRKDDLGLHVDEIDKENILLTSETAHINLDAPEDEWDCEDGKIDLGAGRRFLLINPIIT
jgi:hypothetical protein